VARVKAFGSVAVAGIGLFVAAALLMHFVQPELDPIQMAVSYYMNGRLGWVLGIGLVAMGIGSLSIAWGLHLMLDRRGLGVGVWLLVVWAIGCIVGGIFPPDPPGHWDQPASLSGTIHGLAGVLAFLAFSPAAWLLSRRIAASPQMVVAPRVLRQLAVLCAISLLAFFVCLAPAFSNRAPYALGLVERVLVALYVAWLVATALIITNRDPNLTARGEKHFSRADVHDGDSAIAWRLER
jgi:Protein of unknown function (DUF998)